MKNMRAADASALRRRVKRYLSLGNQADRRSLILDVLPTFRSLGATAIIGGMVRDLARMGPSGYSSDIDLVVEPYDYECFRSEMKRSGAVPNRFGGFALELGSWSVDVWALRDTWARTSGLREVGRFEDLLECTFFDWDALVYDLERDEVLVQDGYFERVASGILGMNLSENPNPSGSAVRALRRAVLWNVRLSAPLAQYVLDVERKCGWDRLAELDVAAFARPVLPTLDWRRTAEILSHPTWTDGGDAAGPIVERRQPKLI